MSCIDSTRVLCQTHHATDSSTHSCSSSVLAKLTIQCTNTAGQYNIVRCSVGRIHSGRSFGAMMRIFSSSFFFFLCVRSLLGALIPELIKTYMLPGPMVYVLVFSCVLLLACSLQAARAMEASKAYLDDPLYVNNVDGKPHAHLLLNPATLRGQQAAVYLKCCPSERLSIESTDMARVPSAGDGNCAYYSVCNGLSVISNKVCTVSCA